MNLFRVNCIIWESRYGERFIIEAKGCLCVSNIMEQVARLKVDKVFNIPEAIFMKMLEN